MSLYNAIFGTNKDADLLLKMLHFDEEKKNCLGRFRDIYLNEDGTKVIVYTRNGGGNREEYQWVFDDLKNIHPYYLSDYDDDFDNTYAYIEFSIPPEYKEQIKALVTGEKPKNISEKFKQMTADLEAGKKTEETERALNVGRKIFGAMENSKGGIIEIDPEDGTKGEKP